MDGCSFGLIQCVDTDLAAPLFERRACRHGADGYMASLSSTKLRLESCQLTWWDLTPGWFRRRPEDKQIYPVYLVQ